VSAKDKLHDAAKQALIKDGWTITHDPLRLLFGQRKVYVDMGAEKPIGAEKDGRKIAVEVKSFLGESEVADLEQAMGQYFLYEYVLSLREPERALYLALSSDAFSIVFRDSETLNLLTHGNIHVVIFDDEREEIVRWIE
jgi:hypothetical protein